MPDIFELADQFRNELLKKDRAAIAEMEAAYKVSYDRIRVALDDLLRQIRDARKQGQAVSKAWLNRSDRLRSFLQQIEAEVQQFSTLVDTSITTRQREAVQKGREDALSLLNKATEPPTREAARVIGVFDRIPVAAVETMVGQLRDTSPLHDLLETLAPKTVRFVKDELISGIVNGENPWVVARRIKQITQIPLWRAARISRTEILRAYRSATLASYRENEDVVEGWIWTASLGIRTCPVCIALHGTLHPLSQKFFATHPNCRCCAVPRTKSWEELGIDGVEDTRPEMESGEEWFAKQDDSFQEEVLGPRKIELYKRGKITLSDLVGEKRSEKWGPSKYEKSLAEVA